jgi:hypothetical protein
MMTMSAIVTPTVHSLGARVVARAGSVASDRDAA